MKRFAQYVVSCIVAAVLSVPCHAQDFSLKGRSSLELNVGLWGGGSATNTIAVTGIRAQARTNGFTGSLVYNRWLQQNLSLTLRAGFLAGEASTTVSSSGVDLHASSVIPILLGVRYYLPYPASDDAVRPFLSLAVGPYLGFEANNTVTSQEALSETAFGGRVGIGLDFPISNHFLLGARAGYNLMADFSTPIGARKNYSSGEFSFGFGYIF
jgi:outer membrane protein W